MDDKDLEEIKRLVEQKPPVKNRPPILKDELMRRKAERDKLRRRQKIIMNTADVVIIALFIFDIILLFKSCSTDHSLVGTWDYDTVTVYHFEKGGSGALKLPNGTYEFTYKIVGEKLSIDFQNEFATDNNYTYTVSKDTFVLVSDDGRTFEMKKVQ